MFWTWMHLLQCDVFNQTLSTEEDRENKNYRPLPAGRLTLRDALILRWVLVPVCLLYSLCNSTQAFYVSAVFSVINYIYNDMRFNDGHWAIRNLLVACGFTLFGAGATLIASM